MVTTNVLDKGFVELLSYTPSGDLLVVNAARASFDKEHDIFDEEKDARLINYLAQNKHVLPFRHPHVTLRIYAPIFVLRQLGKHQVGFSWSEVSRRYVSSEPDFYVPDTMRERPKGNIKQGSGDALSDEKNEFCLKAYKFSCDVAVAEYNKMIEYGVAPEIARAVLPQSMYTTTVTTGSLLGWHHMYKMRTEELTQLESHKYAEAIGSIIGKLYPYSWEALCRV